MKHYTDVPYQQVANILMNTQRAILVKLEEGTAVGEIISFISESDVAKRLDCLRVVCGVVDLPTGKLVPLRPRTNAEKEASKCT